MNKAIEKVDRMIATLKYVRSPFVGTADYDRVNEIIRFLEAAKDRLIADEQRTPLAPRKPRRLLQLDERRPELDAPSAAIVGEAIRRTPPEEIDTDRRDRLNHTIDDIVDGGVGPYRRYCRRRRWTVCARGGTFIPHPTTLVANRGWVIGDRVRVSEEMDGRVATIECFYPANLDLVTVRFGSNTRERWTGSIDQLMPVE